MILRCLKNISHAFWILWILSNFNKSKKWGERKSVKKSANYLCFGQPHRLKSDENVWGKHLTENIWRKTLDGKHLTIISEETTAGSGDISEEKTAGSTDISDCTAFALSHGTGGPPDISWPESPTVTVSCTAHVLRHRTGRPPDVSWPSSPIGTVSCAAFVQGIGRAGHRTSAGHRRL